VPKVNDSKRDMLQAQVEAIVLTTRSPVSADAIVQALNDEGAEVGKGTVEEALVRLRERYDQPDSGVRLELVAGRWRCVTPPELDGVLSAFHGAARRQRLSQAALEVLAIAAYQQPVTLPEISFIRGVNSSGVVKTLLERGLLRVAGRKDVVGKPFLYRTTSEFLIHFGINDPKDLPEPKQLMLEEESTVEDLSAGTNDSEG
jgi:segregation and condensation protein B